jgi:hypothetical protein
MRDDEREKKRTGEQMVTCVNIDKGQEKKETPTTDNRNRVHSYLICFNQ